MSIVLRKYFWAVVLVALACVAYFIASGINQFVGAAFMGDEIAESGTAPPRRPPSRSLFASRRRADGILKRNLFDHTLGPQDGRSQEDDSASRLPSDTSGVPPKCEGAVDLVSTVVSDDPEWSFAALNGGGKTMLYRVGSEIEGKQIARITWQYVFLMTGGSECYLAMFDPATTPGSRPPSAGGAVAAASPGRDSASTGDQALDQVIDQSIEKVSENEYSVERSLVDRLLENQATLMRTARILPHEENGAVTGFKIYGVRRSSLLGKIGLHNGDIIHSINGYDMTSPDKALEAYARLRTADRLTVRITRRGQQLNMDYNIR